MFFVMADDRYNTTICTTHDKNIAEWVAARYLAEFGVRCIIRWASNRG
jgi:hypothetical protein